MKLSLWKQKMTSLRGLDSCVKRGRRTCQQHWHATRPKSKQGWGVKQHWAWILLGWETLQGMLCWPLPPADRTVFSDSVDWDPLKQTKKQGWGTNYLLTLVPVMSRTQEPVL